MQSWAVYFVRLLPVLFISVGAMIYVVSVESNDAYVWRNLLPMIAVIVLAFVALQQGDGSWSGSGWCWPLAVLGFAVPAIGLSLYIHYGYATDLDGMYSESIYPTGVFRYLPIFTTVAGSIGFAIGWIAGRNV